MEPTYYDKRKCLNCNAPISDQTHALSKFCPRIELEDGTVISCKDDFHSKKNKKENLAYRKLIAHHKLMTKTIDELIAIKGDMVTIDDINQAGINLNMPIHFDVTENDQNMYGFTYHTITKTKENQYKIYRHGSIL